MDARQRAAEVAALTTAAGTRPYSTAIPGVTLIRGEVPRQQLAAVYRPMVGFVVQGTKTLGFGGRDLVVTGPSYFLLPLPIPATGTVRPDAQGEPYVSVSLEWRPQTLHDLLGDLPEISDGGDWGACPADAAFCEAWVRMLRLQDTPEAIPALAPVYEREILYRVLAGPQGNTLRRIAGAETGLTRIAESAAWIRGHFEQPLDIATLARRACVAATTYHRQFKKATGMSPIQYQKRLRLLEARQLIAFGGRTAADAAYAVGYQSPSQFNREYAHFFGAPPARDAAQFRRLATQGTEGEWRMEERTVPNPRSTVLTAAGKRSEPAVGNEARAAD